MSGLFDLNETAHSTIWVLDGSAMTTNGGKWTLLDANDHIAC